jgi:hypothetical protein
MRTRAAKKRWRVLKAAFAASLLEVLPRDLSSCAGEARGGKR